MSAMRRTYVHRYDQVDKSERRDLVKYLISEVELFPREEQKTQKRFVKAIAYKFTIEQKVLTQFDECGASVETVCLLSKVVDWYKTCLLNDEKLLNNQENGVRIYEILK